jgi:hypothetical protein
VLTLIPKSLKHNCIKFVDSFASSGARMTAMHKADNATELEIN